VDKTRFVRGPLDVGEEDRRAHSHMVIPGNAGIGRHASPEAGAGAVD